MLIRGVGVVLRHEYHVFRTLRIYYYDSFRIPGNNEVSIGVVGIVRYYRQVYGSGRPETAQPADIVQFADIVGVYVGTIDFIGGKQVPAVVR